ncbi:DUF6233 domain-containing protein [Streptomyces sp. NRRL F-5527]|uniref:DUF6233 domain-containing protein n=1 Tax=Streptomyces TaxID=1883 RepID=UPI001F393E1C|nr:DUF6233 domain-containing protein [Streptomyces sp. NRRL F-5527]
MDHGRRFKKFDELPPKLDRLPALRMWHTMWLQRIDAKIATLARRQTEEERGRRNQPVSPEWIIDSALVSGTHPCRSVQATATWPGKRDRPVDRDEARRLLAAGLKACGHCRPDNLLGTTELSSSPALTAAAAR